MPKPRKIFLFILSLTMITFFLGVKGFDLSSQLKAQSEEISDSIDLSNLVADINLEARKSILYMPEWPEQIEEEKVLFIPSTGIGTIYLCPYAASLAEVTPQCEEIEILDVGEVRDNMFVDTTTYNGQEYYLVYGVRGAGGGEAHRTQLVYQGDLKGQYSDKINLKAILTTIKDGKPVAGKTINFVLGNQTASAITDENGMASTTMDLCQTPGKYALEAEFIGEDDYLPSSDSQPFEILKENVIVSVSNKEGFTFDNLTLEAQVLDDDGDALKKGPCEVEFEVNGKVIGNAQISENGQAKIDWGVNLIPKELTETYPIIVSFAGNKCYNPTKGEDDFTLKSAKWLKQEVVSDLKSVKTGNRKTDKRIDRIIWFLNQSLNEDLWKDASHLVFFDKGRCKKIEKLLRKPLRKDKLKLKEIKSECPKSGMVVFHYEKVAVRLMMNEIKFKKNQDELKTIFDNAIKKLVKADFLLARVSLFKAKNTEVQDPKLKRVINRLIKKAERELIQANKEIERKRSDKAIMRLGKSWLYSQLAIKFATKH